MARIYASCGHPVEAFTDLVKVEHDDRYIDFDVDDVVECQAISMCCAECAQALIANDGGKVLVETVQI